MAFLPGVRGEAPRGRMYVISGSSLCVLREAPASRIPVEDAGDALYLGALDGEPCFARSLADGAPPPEGTEVLPLRKLFGALTDEEFGVAGRALGLTAWDRDHRFCGRCGSPTERDGSERVRRCTACDNASYPRLSPAIIVLVERDGRALLARNARVALPFFTTLAGFVEVGETLEECVAREVHEEAGIEVTDVRYFGSQPWPFTGSLMVGFTARWLANEIHEDPTEIADAAWFAPDALPTIPPRLSIARALIDDFVRRHGGA